MQLAIALSQSEAQAKEEQKKRITSNSTVAGPKASSSSLASLEPKVLHFKKIRYNYHVTFFGFTLTVSLLPSQIFLSAKWNTSNFSAIR